MGAASRAGREHLQGSSPPDSTERALIWFGTRADPRGRGPPCVMQANRTPVPMAVSSPSGGLIVTNMTAGPEGVVRFYNGRGTAEQWTKEGKYALNWTRLSCQTIAWPCRT